MSEKVDAEGGDVYGEEELVAFGNDQPTEYFRVRNIIKGKNAPGVEVVARDTLRLIDLKFTIRNFKHSKKATYLQRVGSAAILIVEFPPQHLAESILDPTSPGAAASGGVGHRGRLAGKSRISFTIKNDFNHFQLDFGLTRGLLAWPQTSNVHRRARAEIGTGIAAQLEAAFGRKVEDLEQFRLEEAVKEIAEAFVGPAAHETALEMSGRLLLSPAESAKWQLLPSNLKNLRNGVDASVPLWSARLDRAGRRSVRAIWSRNFTDGVIPQFPIDAGQAPGPAPRAPDLLPLTPRDHWQIVGQTSVYGLPALRRLKADIDPAAAEPTDAPNANVVRPGFSIGFLDEIDSNEFGNRPDSGIAIAKPFQDADILLTALGGIFTAEWKGEPPRLLPKTSAQTPWSGFDLERLAYRSWLGRDSHVVAVYKGFLFPLGIRASFVKVHERRIVEENGEFVSRLFRRYFIVAPGSRRQYPGPYHPYDARDFPVGSVRMKTLVTPDLRDPLPDALVTVGQDGTKEAAAFWPRIDQSTGTDGYVQFEWMTEDGAVATSPLIFVINTIVDDRVHMPTVFSDYQSDERRRIARFAGARTRYARPFDPKTEPGKRDVIAETSYDTHEWRLGVQPRIDGDLPFRMDGRMEGADQPPFYPFVEEAKIGVQSLDRLLGRSHGRYAVGFHALYRKHGFGSPLVAPHEIYLEFKGGPASMDCSEDARATGALVNQAANIRALSRLTGLVGADLPKKKDGTAAAADDTTDPLGPALKGDFDPATFFSQADLFGIVAIAKVLQNNESFSNDAPKTLESIDYGATGEAALKMIHAAASSAIDVIGRIDGPLRTWLTSPVASNTTVTPMQLYKALSLRLLEFLDKAPAELEKVRKENDVGKLALTAKPLVELLRSLLRELESIVEDPVPEIFREVLNRLRQLNNLLVVPADVVQALAPTMRSSAASWFRAAFGGVIAGEIGEILLGRKLQEADLGDLRIALDSADRALFHGALAGPLQALAAELEYASDGNAWRALEAAVLSRLPRHALELIANCLRLLDLTKLEDPPPDGDIRHASVQRMIVDRFVAAVRDAVVATVTEDVWLDDLVVHVRHLRDELPQRLDAAVTRLLADVRASIHPLEPADPDGIRDCFVDGMSFRLTQELEPVLVAALDVLHEALLAIQKRRDKVVELVLAQVEQLLQSWLDSNSLAQIARACAAACAPLDAVATRLTTHVTGPVDGAITDLDYLITQVEAWIPQLAAGVLGRLLGEIRALRSVLAAFSQATDAGFTVDFCNRPDAGLREFRRYMQLRRDVAASLKRIAQLLLALPGTIDPQDVQAWAVGFARLFLQLLGINLLQSAASSISAYLDALPQEAAPHAERIRAELQVALDRAQVLQQQLANVTPAVLEIATRASDDLLDSLDRKLSATLLKAVAFAEKIVGNLTVSCAAAIRNVTRADLAPPVTCLHEVLATTFEALADLANDDVVNLVLRLATGQTDLPKKFREQAWKLTAEADDIHKLSTASDADAIAGALRLVQKPSELKVSTDLIKNGFVIVDVGQRFVESVLSVLEDLLAKVRALAQQFLPTRMVTKYAWGADLGSYPDNGDWVFAMSEKNPGDTAKHLQLTGDFVFDAVTGRSTVTVKGILKPFKLRLVGSFHIATINFTDATFVSEDGSSPDFDVKVGSVDIGPQLQYLQALQQWLSPNDNGFYLKPILSPSPGIEAGYHYEAGLIQLGNLQFINVAFNVAARLFIDGTKAEFEFKFADEKRPFLIAAPPYGGGGWLCLVANADGVNRMAMSFVFGGVAALKFGPLEAQGRVVAGISVRDEAGKPVILEAIFEAVGEGSIACFSVSVFIRITLTQTGSNLFGRAVYGFSFRVGFAKFSYRVEARYTLKGGKDSSAQLASSPSNADTGPAQPLLQSKLEPKAGQWRAYRRHFSLDLI